MEMDTEFELEWHRSKDKELTLFFINKFNVWDFSTLFFFRLVRRVIEGKIIQKLLKERKITSSKREVRVSEDRVTEGKITVYV